ncbi:MAG: hydroxyacid dehydrogenase [Elusimicrobia bacterium HGW-Elusimicrobia-2]|nr:MAG: hydroxyacid dehydrogenase [Elusimicrobia bacterium HGW-Elusimicrobia-2]
MKENSEIVLYTSPDGQIKVEVRLQDETVWLTQSALAELYQTTPQNITLHLKAIYAEGELDKIATCKEYLQVQKEGARQISRKRKFYNLPAILAVGYRVHSPRGTQFRKWATACLNEFLVKGFLMDDERLKAGVNIGSDYFDEILERIRDIRSSEKRFYQKIRDIYKLAVDYDPTAEKTLEFFSIVQNKLHFAISGKTAAELIAERSDSKKNNMGLTAWKGVKVRKGDVIIAKNYLNESEMDGLNRIVTMYLDYAEDQAKRHRQIFMRDWQKKLNAFLKLNERMILRNSGKVSKKIADELAIKRYGIYHQQRLTAEAQREAIEDDNELKRIQKKIEKKRRKNNGKQEND